MSGIKNIKKKLKGFQVRPPNAEVIKKVLLHIPYVVVFYVVNKCTWLYQYCRGSTVVDRLMVLLMNYPLAFKKLLPSIQPKSLAAGTIAAVSVWAVVYFKGKKGKKFRQGEEYGSARWGNEKDIAPFIDPVFENNILLTQTERLTMNSRPKKPKYARNKNVIVIGGSGSGKTRFYVKPQLMQMPDNVSFVVTDPKGTIIVECGKMLARGTPKKDKNGKILRDKNGRVVMAPYKIKVLNTINFAKSMHYNPFHYIRSEKDILKLVNTIMVNTKGEGEKSSEDFWTKAERLLYCALIGYIYYEAPEEEQNFSTLLEFINASETREEDEEFKNAVDLLFEELERDEPNHFAVRQYKKYKLAAGKTAKSILISCGARLAPFDIAELRELMSYDEMELDMIGDQRTALFIVISDTDDTFNFVVAMMYSQLFNLLCDRADDVHHGRLPYHVRILCDEFANIGQIPKFDKLIATMKRLRDLGNTLIVVEHDEDTMRQADYIVDVGPGAGVHGGEIVAAGSVADICKVKRSITGAYLSGRKFVEVPETRREGNGKALRVVKAHENNLQDITVDFPLGKLICVTGVSGSGKSTLVNEILYKTLAAALNGARSRPGQCEEVEGMEWVDKVIGIDQSPIGRTPRSNPATYTGVFGDIRTLFSNTQDAKMRGYGPGRFSFNVKGGRCEACEGGGILTIEMHFLPDIYVPCDVCKGKRYNRETLEVKYKDKTISDVLDMTVEEACVFFANIPKIARKLQTLQEVGLGYIQLGQAATTLSGGEAQRVKLANELARRDTGQTVYILDEPTTGLHVADVHRLVKVLDKLVDAGNTVIVIEHNLDVIKRADYIIDLGPEGGSGGGTIVATGTPEEVAQNPHSFTGQYLRPVLERAAELQSQK